jgi:hypothetical protein
MKNPFGDQQLPGSYHNLKERMYKKVSEDVSEQLFRDLQNAYESALNEENIVLSRPERKRLFSQIITMVMEDMHNRLDTPPARKQA